MRYFNPRPPRGGRLTHVRDLRIPPQFQSTPPARGATSMVMAAYHRPFLFQSTPPARGATVSAYFYKQVFFISIHAPREGGDEEVARQMYSQDHFNPRPPRGGRRWSGRTTRLPLRFQSTPPARGATTRSREQRRDARFQSTPPARGATAGDAEGAAQLVISIHAPREGGDVS